MPDEDKIYRICSPLSLICMWMLRTHNPGTIKSWEWKINLKQIEVKVWHRNDYFVDVRHDKIINLLDKFLSQYYITWDLTRWLETTLSRAQTSFLPHHSFSIPLHSFSVPHHSSSIPHHSSSIPHHSFSIPHHSFSIPHHSFSIPWLESMYRLEVKFEIQSDQIGNVRSLCPHHHQEWTLLLLVSAKMTSRHFSHPF